MWMAKEGIIRRLISVQLHSRMERLFPMGTTDVSVFVALMYLANPKILMV